jgi:hypothetical protein
MGKKFGDALSKDRARALNAFIKNVDQLVDQLIELEDTLLQLFHDETSREVKLDIGNDIVNMFEGYELAFDDGGDVYLMLDGERITEME